MAQKINIRGVEFDAVTFEEALGRLTGALRTGTKTALFTPNSEIVQACVEDLSLYPVINSAELITPDGIGVVKAGRILGTPFPGGRVAGFDLGRELLRDGRSGPGQMTAEGAAACAKHVSGSMSRPSRPLSVRARRVPSP